MNSIATSTLTRKIHKSLRPHIRSGRGVVVRTYLSGWVSNNYKWKTMGKYVEYRLNNDTGRWEMTEGQYDRKRSYGLGPTSVVRSEKGGVLGTW